MMSAAHAVNYRSGGAIKLKRVLLTTYTGRPLCGFDVVFAKVKTAIRY